MALWRLLHTTDVLPAGDVVLQHSLPPLAPAPQAYGQHQFEIRRRNHE